MRLRAANLLLIGCLIPAAIAVAGDAAAARPGIVLCMTDDQGWGDVGYNGPEKIRTPNIDALVAAGLRFDSPRSVLEIHRSSAKDSSRRVMDLVLQVESAASDEHGAGSPDDNPKCHRFHRVRSGFLSTSLKSAAGKSTIVFQHPDVNGAVVHGWTVERRTKA